MNILYKNGDTREETYIQQSIYITFKENIFVPITGEDTQHPCICKYVEYCPYELRSGRNLSFDELFKTKSYKL